MEKNINDIIADNAKLVGYTVSKYFPQEIGNEDVWQIGLIGLWQAIEAYDEARDTKFETFAITIIKRKIASFIRDKLRLKRNDKDKVVYDGEETSYLNIVADRKAKADMDFNTMMNNLWKDFEQQERVIVNLKVKGRNNKEIADTLNISEKTVRRRIKKIKDKFDDYI